MGYVLVAKQRTVIASARRARGNLIREEQKEIASSLRSSQ
jgi:hypothetical protein